MKYEQWRKVNQVFGNGLLPIAIRFFLEKPNTVFVVNVDSKYTPKYLSNICPSEITEFMIDCDEQIFDAIDEQFGLSFHDYSKVYWVASGQELKKIKEQKQ